MKEKGEMDVYVYGFVFLQMMWPFFIFYFNESLQEFYKCERDSLEIIARDTAYIPYISRNSSNEHIKYHFNPDLFQFTLASVSELCMETNKINSQFYFCKLYPYKS